MSVCARALHGVRLIGPANSFVENMLWIIMWLIAK